MQQRLAFCFGLHSSFPSLNHLFWLEPVPLCLRPLWVPHRWFSQDPQKTREGLRSCGCSRPAPRLLRKAKRATAGAEMLRGTAGEERHSSAFFSTDRTALRFHYRSLSFQESSRLGEHRPRGMARGYLTWGTASSSPVTVQGFSINSVYLAFTYQILPITNYTMGSQWSIFRLEYFSLLGK